MLWLSSFNLIKNKTDKKQQLRSKEKFKNKIRLKEQTEMQSLQQKTIFSITNW